MSLIRPDAPEKRLRIINLFADATSPTGDSAYGDHYSLFTHIVEEVVATGWCNRQELLEHFAYFAREELEGMASA